MVEIVMETSINEKKLERTKALYDYFRKQEGHFDNKWNRARKYENKMAHYDKYKYYRKLHDRAYQLYRRLEVGRKFGTGRMWFEQTAEQWKQFRAELKQKRRLEFESCVKVAVYFMSESLRSDYGTFTCSKCGSTFYHSPCNIYRGANMERENVCGHCANTILTNNGQETIYY